MITTARPLPLREIINCKEVNNNKTVWCGGGQEEVLTHKSWVSLQLIMRWFFENNGRKPIVFIPKFYCYDTIYQIQDDAEFVYYDIDGNFLPDYKQCALLRNTQQPDLFIFVHFFGMHLEANNAKVFCKNNNAFLIEDAAHVLIGSGKTGKCGDFVLYSPWKSLGLPDGAVLLINAKGPSGLEVTEIQKQIKALNDINISYPSKLVNIWKAKKIIQKVLPNRNTKPLMDDSVLYKKNPNYQISNYSRNQLLTYTLKDILTLGDKKRINALLIEDCLTNEYAFEPIRINGYPYAETLKINEGYKEIWERLSGLGQVVFTWPDLNMSLERMDNAKDLKKQLLHIAVHDGLNPDIIHRKLYKKKDIADDIHLELKQITEGEYDAICNQMADPVPLLQTTAYAKAKLNAEGWIPRYWLVKDDARTVAFFLTLTKYRLIHRINRGPYLMDLSLKDTVYRLIKNKFGKKGYILFWAPESEQTGANINKMLRMGCKYRGSYFSTGYLDLRTEVDVLRKNMDSKWRNQLKASEKMNLQVFHANSEEVFFGLLQKHTIDKEKRDYRDSGDSITEQLFKNGNLLALYVKGNDREIISFVIIARHNKTATYYIGWSNQEGYQKNANRYLLWEAVKELKKENYEWFDMGGIDLVNTRSIAEFKLGLGSSHFNLVGEYYLF